MPQDSSNHAYRFPLRYRDFCVFWTGSLLSGIGSQFSTVAMAWQLYELTDSAFQVGLLGLARAVPQMGLLLVAGLLADAMDRRKLMMCTDIGLFGVSMALALLTLAGKASAGLLAAGCLPSTAFSQLAARNSVSLSPAWWPPGSARSYQP